ncbi:cobaltochelatase subunit CobN [Mesorhizobium sp. L-8-10]|uniref:cobaltochelatase subunit CobN n=1 Tax=Mesorhizobium sp. L-8-10 TaxID=2744523 RepID=UPI00192863F4|nr:cobaltochelatase subunit CobN [Mesorhizobium sp. L-8-10]BCH35436.1 cobaltochelatase subunit CobN [Mesorhizobium sp. L-8-10]
MHILATTTASLDDLIEPVDLRQTPAEMVALSFTDSDLAALATAWKAEETALPSMRLARLRDLRHPMSVDLWIDGVARHAKVILVRLLGGYDWWRYGCDRLAAVAREHGIRLVLLPGECRETDETLAGLSTLPTAELDGLLAYFREGGPQNMRGLLRRLARHAGSDVESEPAEPLAKVGFYDPQRGVVSLEMLNAARPQGAPVAPILFYRSMLLAADVAPVDALCAALVSRGIFPLPIFVSSLKDPAVIAFVEKAVRDVQPSLIITTTAFASGTEGGETLFDRIGLPVLQAVVATTRRDAWESGQRGLAPADLAMHVVLPELDGRILAGAIAFKADTASDDALAFQGQVNRPEADRIEQFAERVANLVRLRETPRGERRIAILIPDYPAAGGRTGYAVGLDVPQSVLAMLHDLRAEGYEVENIPETPRDLLKLLEREGEGISISDYRRRFGGLSEQARGKIEEAWGRIDEIGLLSEKTESGRHPSSDRASRGHLLPQGEKGRPAARSQPIFNAGDLQSRPSQAPSFSPCGRRWPREARSDEGYSPAHFTFRAARFGNVTVALAPDRGRSEDRRADYHDPSLPPTHALLAFGFWLRENLGCHALVHVGAHGTLEWLPGKTVALSRDCFPEIVTGPLPVIYPFIVSNPGEAAQAKRRIAAVTIGHLPPPLVGAGLDENQQRLERLVDEYAQADGLDRRRRDRLAKLIVETATQSGLAREAGVNDADDPDAALMRIDAWLCDLKDLSIKEGLHVYGRSPENEADPQRRESAEAERLALVAALDGRHISAGPSGAPARGRTDVLPTGRNLFASDPRTMPTPTAYDLGKAAAEEVLRRHLQDHGDWPRALVIDLWGSASLRTGGEEIAQGLALMGCRPQWDPATGRITAIEVLPPAVLGRPRVDVTWRISGLFRDMFPTQIALMDAATLAVAARDEAAGDNPLAEAARKARSAPARIFGSSPGSYGAGVEELLASGRWQTRDEIGRAYLEATSHAFGGAEGQGRALPGAFAARVAEAELLIHTGDDPGRDILEGSADVAFIGGFAAALAALGSNADVITLDTTDPVRPRARSVAEAVTRVVRARAINPRFIDGQLRHGPRGASEFAETVDRLIGFAETTAAIPGALIEAVHDAYLGDEKVRTFLLRENPAAARAIAERFAAARRRGLWHPLRNSIDDDLAALIEEARAQEIAA